MDDANHHSSGGQTITLFSAGANLLTRQVAGDDGDDGSNGTTDEGDDVGDKGANAGDEGDDGQGVGVGRCGEDGEGQGEGEGSQAESIDQVERSAKVALQMEMNAYQANLEKYVAAQKRLSEVEEETRGLEKERDKALEVLRQQAINIDDLVECARAQKLNLQVQQHGKVHWMSISRKTRTELQGDCVVYERVGEWGELKAFGLEALVKLDADRLPSELGGQEALETVLRLAGEDYDFEYETKEGHEHYLKIANYLEGARAGKEYKTIFEWGWGKDLEALCEEAKRELEQRRVGGEIG